MIKEIQKRLTLNTYDPLRWKKGERPGEYKKGDYVTGKNETGAWPEDVPDEMQELIEDIGDVDDKNALTAGGFFFSKFLILLLLSLKISIRLPMAMGAQDAW